MPKKDQVFVHWEALRHSNSSLADSCRGVPGLTIWGMLQAASVRARIRGRYFMEVCLVLGGGKVKVLGDDRLANLRLTAYSDEIGTDSEANRHAVRANRQSEESERSDAGILFIT